MIATGSVYPEVERVFKEYPQRGTRLVYQNLGNGRFKDVTKQAGPGVMSLKSSRGCAFGDFDNDGDIDVLVMNMNEPPLLLRNDYNNERRRGPNNWLTVELTGTKSNRSAIGARVILRNGSHVQLRKSRANPVTTRTTTCACTSAWAQAGKQIRSRFVGLTGKLKQSKR